MMQSEFRCYLVAIADHVTSTFPPCTIAKVFGRFVLVLQHEEREKKTRKKVGRESVSFQAWFVTILTMSFAYKMAHKIWRINQMLCILKYVSNLVKSTAKIFMLYNM